MIKNIPKTELRALRELAFKLPSTYQDGEEERMVFGRTLIARGICIVDGKGVIPDKKYLYKIREKLPVNHFRRMKNLYMSTGSVEELKKYCDGVMELVQASKKPLNFSQFNSAKK